MPKDAAPALHIDTRYERYKSRTVRQPVETIDFTGRFAHEIHFSLRLAHIQTRKEQAVVLLMSGWGYNAYPLMGGGTITVHTDGENAVLEPLPDSKMHTSDARERTSFEEHLSFPLPAGLLGKISTAREAGLLLENFQGVIDVDAATVGRFQAYCRSFYHVVVKPAEALQGGGSKPA